LAGWGVGLLLLIAFVGMALSAYDEVAFRQRVVAMDRRMKRVGGGFTNGRREYSRHVKAWVHDRSVGDDDMAIIAAVLRDWQRGGWSDELALDLSGTNISDSGLVALHEVRPLKSIELTGTKVTAAGIEGIRRGNPGLRIHWDRDSIGPEGRRSRDGWVFSVRRGGG
jgi:hypothetical protein